MVEFLAGQILGGGIHEAYFGTKSSAMCEARYLAYTEPSFLTFGSIFATDARSNVGAVRVSQILQVHKFNELH